MDALPRATMDNGRIIIETRFDSELVGFLRTLPNARWSKKERHWSVLPTEATAAKLVERRGMHTCEEIAALSGSWHRGFRLTPNGAAVPGETTTSWPHQRDAYWFAEPKKASMLSMDMGTGKSKVAVDLVRNWHCRKILILCPKSVLGVWHREFRRHAQFLYEVTVLDKNSHSSARKAETAAEALKANDHCVIAVNYETARQPPFAKWALSENWDCLILDESHRAKEPSGVGSMFCFRVSQKAARRLCLTGTPMPHSPLDIFAQYRSLDAGIFGTGYVRFRLQYARMNALFPEQVDEWINEDELKKLYHQIAFRVEAKDVLDLPPQVHEERYCTLSPNTRRVYDEMKNLLIAEIDSGVVTAANALVKLLRLQQVADGFIGYKTNEEGRSARTETLGTEKADLLYDLLVDLPLSEPVVVFCKFHHDLDQIHAVAERLGRTSGELAGRGRRDITDDATMPPGIDLLATQIQSGGVGIDLTRAAYCVFFSVGFNMGDYEQAIARLHRPGQTRPVRYYHLLAKDTVDHAVYGALRKRKRLIDAIISDIRSNA